MSSLVALFKVQRRLELNHVKTLKPTLKIVSDQLASALLEAIIHDSRKHAAFCKLLIDIESGKGSSELDVENAIEVYQAIEEHLEVEAEMLNHLKSLLGKADDSRSKAIINYMLSDERRHHNTLKRMADLFNQIEREYDEYLNLVERYLYP